MNINKHKFDGWAYILNGSPVIRNSTFSGNGVVSFGGGIYCLNGSPVIRGCVISGNGCSSYESKTEGGGIYALNAAMLIVNCALFHNSVRGSEVSGGGISTSTETIIGCVVYGNEVIGRYGGANSGGIKLAFESITSCTVFGNSVSGDPLFGSSSGGGIICSDLTQITNNIIWNNSPGNFGWYRNSRDEISIGPVIYCDIMGEG